MQHKLESELRKYIVELSNKKKVDWFPIFMYDFLEENVPHGLVVKLGEIIVKNKGVGYGRI